ncbi:MAG: hypothetical protein IVW36_00825 [Dehalococcoidia bacterium]|nr:hypothetical protein [Dehalococcoidia bacterium]
MLGALMGCVLGGFGVLGFFLFQRDNPRRKDWLFGSWFGFGLDAVVAAIFVAAVVSMGGGATSSSAHQTAASNAPVRDVVVGAARVCVSGCTPPAGCVYVCGQQYAEELTVRTPSGSTYTARVPVGTNVDIGQAWPPQ